MRKLVLAVALTLPFAAQAETLPVVFMSGNTLPDAKGACEMGLGEQKGAAECRSVKDPQILGRQLEYKVQNSMVTNPRCAGVAIVQGWYQPYDGGSYDKGAAAKYVPQQQGIIGL